MCKPLSISTLIIILVLAVFQAHADDESDPHRHHRVAIEKPTVQVGRYSYDIPDIQLQDQDGQVRQLHELFAEDRPVALNFIFTSCTTICPVMTATMLQMQGQLASDANQPVYVSISIDPDYDSAAILNEYATNFGADWTFLTGNREDVLRVLKTFDAYRGTKVNHFALTLMKAANDDEWTRIEGLTSAQDLAKYWRALGS